MFCLYKSIVVRHVETCWSLIIKTIPIRFLKTENSKKALAIIDNALSQNTSLSKQLPVNKICKIKWRDLWPKYWIVNITLLYHETANCSKDLKICSKLNLINIYFDDFRKTKIWNKRRETIRFWINCGRVRKGGIKIWIIAE